MNIHPPSQPIVVTEHPFRRRFMLNLRGRIMRMLGSVILVMLVLYVTSVVYFIYRNEVSNWRNRQGEAARNAAQTVADFLSHTEVNLRLTSMYLSDLNNHPTVLANLLRENPAILEVIFLDTDGTLLASKAADRPMLANLFTIPQSQWFRSAVSGQKYYSNVQISTRDEPYIIISLPMEGGRVAAVRLNMIVLWQVVSDIRFGENGHVFVVNRDGQVIAHTNPNVVKSYFTIADRPEYQAILSAPENRWYGESMDFNANAVVSVSAPVGQTGWLVITELPQSEAYANSRQAILFLSLIALLMAVPAMLVSREMMGRLVIGPVENLRRGAEQVGQGNLDVHIGVERMDEIGQVTGAFNQMAARLKDQRTALHQRAVEFEALYEIGLSLISNLELEIVLKTILTSARNLFPSVIDSDIYFYDSGRLSFAASLQNTGEASPAKNSAKTGSVAEDLLRAAQTGEIVKTRGGLAAALGYAPGISVSIPLRIGGLVVGVMKVEFDHPYDITDADLRSLRLLGDQAAIAIENARLYEQAQSEILEREQAQEALKQLNEQLEARVEERTLELTALNQELVREVAERKAAEAQVRSSLEEKEVLLKEIHHRVKNNLQVISSLLNLQSTRMKDQQMLEALRDSQFRVRSMALIHEKLYQSKNLAQIEFDEYLRSLANFLFQSYRRSAGGVNLRVNAEKVALSIDQAVPCGLILNELISNALKHAWPDGRQGLLEIDLILDGQDTLTLSVADDGQGLPKDLDLEHSKSLGLTLVSTLVQQLDGTLEIQNRRGACFTISFEYQS